MSEQLRAALARWAETQPAGDDDADANLLAAYRATRSVTPDVPCPDCERTHPWMDHGPLDETAAPSTPEPGVDVGLLRVAVVVEMENEGVVTWGDPRHRERFLASASHTWADIRKFIRWSANVRDDTEEAISVAKDLDARLASKDR